MMVVLLFATPCPLSSKLHMDKAFSPQDIVRYSLGICLEHRSHRISVMAMPVRYNDMPVRYSNMPVRCSNMPGRYSDMPVR